MGCIKLQEPFIGENNKTEFTTHLFTSQRVAEKGVLVYIS